MIQQGMKRQTENLILIENEIDNIHLNISQIEIVNNEDVMNIK
jgi:hypothetical protein